MNGPLSFHRKIGPITGFSFILVTVLFSLSCAILAEGVIPPTPTSSPTPLPTHTPTSTLTPTPSPTLTPTNSPTPEPSPTPIPPRMGNWVASAKDLGEFTFEVSADSKEIALVSVHFTGFQCHDYTMSGEWRPSAHKGEITNQRFTLSGKMEGYMKMEFKLPVGEGLIQFPEVTITGSFDEQGTGAAGTWQVKWEDIDCSGDWQSSGITSVTPTEQPSDEPFYLYPFCNCEQEVPTGQAPTLRWAWVATSEAYVNDFLQASRTTLKIDGKKYTDLESYWGSVAYSAKDNGYKASWEYPLPPLAAGVHHVEISVSLERAVTDGYDSNNDGEADQYGPGEMSSGWVDVKLSASSGESPAACSNGAPAGHWVLIVTKKSPGDGTITIDGKRVTIKSGENAIYLAAGQNHTVKVGTNTFTYADTIPECGENRLDIP